jgi:hypothetical protein
MAAILIIQTAILPPDISLYVHDVTNIYQLHPETMQRFKHSLVTFAIKNPNPHVTLELNRFYVT